MKNILSIILMTFAFATIVSCSQEYKADKSYDDYKEYVADRRESVDKYFDKEWSELENEYNEKKMKAEENMKEWNEETKAEYESLQNDWAAFKEKYDAERDRRTQEENTAVILNEILPQGISSDMSNVTAGNLLDVHTHFVNYVDLHKDELTREQWDRIELLWEALGTRKNELEKDLKSSDNIKIAEQKVKFGSIKAINRPNAKMEENSEAKEKK